VRTGLASGLHQGTRGRCPAHHRDATRRTCATLLALDIHPRMAMRILRHARIEVTIDICTEVSDEQTLRGPKRLGKQLDSQVLLYKAGRAGSVGRRVNTWIPKFERR
jgi:hypothetical protein